MTVHVTPPTINESNAAYVDWLYVSDYLLICCGTARDDIDAENTQRRASFRPVQQSYALRRLVVLALEIMDKSPKIGDDELLAKLQAIDGDESLASAATIKEAKRWAKAAKKPMPPVKPTEPPEMRLYQSLYFLEPQIALRHNELIKPRLAPRA